MTNAAHDVPVPTSISPEAQAILAMPRASPVDFPDLGDLAGWRQLIAARDEEMLSLLSGMVDQDAAEVERVAVGQGAVYKIVPAGCARDSPKAYLEIHGGALVMGGGECCRITGIMTAVRLGVVTWAVDYRMPPDHPYPAPLDDCLTAYGELVREYGAGHVVVGGTSAGGNLAAATILRARDEDLPLPAAAVLLTPEVDLTESGDSFATNIGLDNLLTQRQMPANLLYAGGHDLTLPYVSPLFGDFTRVSPRLSSGPAPGTSSFRTRFSCTGPYETPAFRPNFTSRKPVDTQASSGWHRKTLRLTTSYAAFSTRTGATRKAAGEPSQIFLTGHQAAVGVDDRSGDEAGGIRGEEKGRPDHLVRRGSPPQQAGLGHGGGHLGGFARTMSVSTVPGAAHSPECPREPRRQPWTWCTRPWLTWLRRSGLPGQRTATPRRRPR